MMNLKYLLMFKKYSNKQQHVNKIHNKVWYLLEVIWNNSKYQYNYMNRSEHFN